MGRTCSNSKFPRSTIASKLSNSVPSTIGKSEVNQGVLAGVNIRIRTLALDKGCWLVSIASKAFHLVVPPKRQLVISIAIISVFF